jgi:hypothetical protein
MHRAYFLILLLATAQSLNGQKQSSSVELNWSYNEGGDQYFEAWIRPAIRSGEVCYWLKSAEVISVRRSEGRLKENLNFSQESGKTCIILPKNFTARSRIYIGYKMTKESFESSPFISLLHPGFVLNALNIDNAQGQGELGLLIPAPISKSFASCRLSLSVDQTLPVSSPWDLEYQLNDITEKTLFFYQKNAFDLSHFHLTVGDFNTVDPEQAMEEIAFQKQTAEDAQIENFSKSHLAMIEFIAQDLNRLFTRERLLELSSAKAAILKPELPRYSDLNESKEELKIKMSLVQEHYPAKWQYKWAEFWQQRLDPLEWQRVLEQRKEKEDSSLIFWDYYLQAYLAETGLSWADSNKWNGKAEGRMMNAKYFIKRRKVLDLAISYQMQAAENKLYIHINRVDSLPLALSFSAKAFLRLSKDSIQQEKRIRAKDTITWSLTESPIVVYVQDDSWGLFNYVESRPLNYLLYDLSKAPNPGLKEDALLELLATENPNLLAMVIGVALDTGDPELQHLALNRVTDLQTNGKARLKTTLQEIAANSEDVKLKQKATQLLADFDR